jgi:hypothetical protein
VTLTRRDIERGESIAQADLLALLAERDALKRERDDGLDRIRVGRMQLERIERERDALEAEVAMLRGVCLRLLDGLKGGHTNAIYGEARDALSATADAAKWLAEHDARVRAAALEEAAKYVESRPLFIDAVEARKFGLQVVDALCALAKERTP